MLKQEYTTYAISVLVQWAVSDTKVFLQQLDKSLKETGEQSGTQEHALATLNAFATTCIENST